MQILLSQDSEKKNSSVVEKFDAVPSVFDDI